MKAEILTLLRQRADYVSGQELCEHFGVSRTAVWKAVGGLKKEGYRIEAVQNRGYRLIEEEEVYGLHELTSRMKTKWAGHPVMFYEQLDSTNAQAKMEAEKGADSGTLIVADLQTAGRGRRGRSWSSPGGINVYFSLILKPEFSPDKASMLTLVMAVSVARGIEKTLRESPRGQKKAASLLDENGEGSHPLYGKGESKIGIKWPNDLVVNGRKICGILTEMSVERDYIRHVVIGVGINVGKQDFLPEIADKATSLEAEFGFLFSRSELTANIMEAFEQDYRVFERECSLQGLKETYEGMLINQNKEVCVLDSGGEYRGTALGITDTGELLVKRQDGRIEEVYAGEVSVRGIYGYV